MYTGFTVIVTTQIMNFHSFQIETANSFHPLDLADIVEIKSPNFDFEPVLHSSSVIDRRHSNRIKHWITLILNCQSMVQNQSVPIICRLTLLPIRQYS